MTVEGIILAAGLSSRMTINKLIMDINGWTVLERCLKPMNNLCSRVIVVGGHRFKDIEFISDLYPKVELKYNDNYLDGMFSSVKFGLSFIQGERFFLIPGDYAAINSNTYRELLKNKGDIVIPTFKGKRGHPLLMNSYLIDEILNDNNLNNLRDFIKLKSYSSVEVKDVGILMDIDTLEDYNKVSSYIRS